MIFSTQTTALRLLCGLSVLMLSAAQQKVFALSPVAPANVADEQQSGPSGKKKKNPLTLHQTLPDVIGARGVGALQQSDASPGDGRFPPLDPSNLRLAPAISFAASAGALPHFACRRPFCALVAPDLPALRAFDVCLPRTGPPAA